MKNPIKETSKDLLVGRKISFFDNLIFYFSSKKWTGWGIGNVLRSLFSGKKKFISNEKIIFIGGFPRSGTGLLQMILKSSSKIDGPYNEFCIFQDIPLREFVKKSFGFEKLSKYSENKLIRSTDSIIKKYKENKNIEGVILKAPKYAFFMGWIFKYFPNARYIHMTRDGRDATISFKKYLEKEMEKGYSFEYCVKNWAAIVNRTKEYEKNKNFLEVKYEDLVKNQFETLKKVFSFLGVKMPSKKELEGFNKNLKKSKIPKSHQHDVTKKVYNSSIKRWKREMSVKEKEIFKKIAGKELVQKGYVKDLDW